LGWTTWRAGEKAKLNPTQKEMDKAIGVEGVGASGQIAKEETNMPCVAKDDWGHTHQINYQAPVVPDSDIPALWGQRSLEKNRTVLDMVNRKLYLCGPGRILFTPPPGTLTFNLEMSRSGHLLLPISHFLGNGKDIQGIAKQQPANWHASGVKDGKIATNNEKSDDDEEPKADKPVVNSSAGPSSC